LFKQISAGQREIAFEVQHGNDGCGHHCRVTHLALAIFAVMQGFEHVST
jgi:hypothetical protein